MWTYDNFPIARANQTLGTHIDQAFLFGWANELIGKDKSVYWMPPAHQCFDACHLPRR